MKDEKRAGGKNQSTAEVAEDTKDKRTIDEEDTSTRPGARGRREGINLPQRSQRTGRIQSCPNFVLLPSAFCLLPSVANLGIE